MDFRIKLSINDKIKFLEFIYWKGKAILLSHLNNVRTDLLLLWSSRLEIHLVLGLMGLLHDMKLIISEFLITARWDAVQIVQIIPYFTSVGLTFFLL